MGGITAWRSGNILQASLTFEIVEHCGVFERYSQVEFDNILLANTSIHFSRHLKVLPVI